MVRDLRIRRPDPEAVPRYYVVPGSAAPPVALITRTDASAYLVVESALDAILLAGLVDDLVGVVAMGNATIKPDAELHRILDRACHLSICLDSDAPTINRATGKPQAAGAQGAQWWLQHYRHAVRVPVIGGKDPGDAYQAGVDLRTWVLAGLPPRFHIKTAAVIASEARQSQPQPGRASEAKQSQPSTPPTLSSRPQGEISPTTKESSAVDVETPAVKHYQLTVGDQEIHVTDSRELWAELSAAGEIVFSEQELARLQAACATMTAEEKAVFIARAIDAKHVFPGAYVRRGEGCA